MPLCFIGNNLSLIIISIPKSPLAVSNSLSLLNVVLALVFLATIIFGDGINQLRTACGIGIARANS